MIFQFLPWMGRDAVTPFLMFLKQDYCNVAHTLNSLGIKWRSGVLLPSIPPDLNQ